VNCILLPTILLSISGCPPVATKMCSAMYFSPLTVTSFGPVNFASPLTSVTLSYDRRLQVIQESIYIFNLYTQTNIRILTHPFQISIINVIQSLYISVSFLLHCTTQTMIKVMHLYIQQWLTYFQLNE